MWLRGRPALSAHASPCPGDPPPAWRHAPAESAQQSAERKAAIRAELLAGGMTAEVLDSPAVGSLISSCSWRVRGATRHHPTCTRLAPAHQHAELGSLQQLAAPCPCRGDKRKLPVRAAAEDVERAAFARYGPAAEHFVESREVRGRGVLSGARNSQASVPLPPALQRAEAAVETLAPAAVKKSQYKARCSTPLPARLGLLGACSGPPAPAC